ncbi:MAG: hypothetical protein IPO88_08385 [Nannocystis sp.]|uniref:hypothetical protein n=1 Tax=Nannocystis sp. TaxID=1962667 RepID=UPI002426508C|nr:hypothetical protein [Nannocystis sp.]MBK9753509.1 hypothetical protein [Nannocystis sp.]
MLRRRLHPLVPALVTLACTSRPAQNTDDAGTGATTGSSTGQTPTEASGSTMVDPPPVICEPCDAPWKLDERLDIGPDTDISQYTCLTEVRGDVGVSGDLSPTQLAPLCHLRVVNGWMSIRDNTLLTDLSPFASLEKVSVLSIYGLPALTKVAGLDSLRSVLELNIGDTGATALGDFAPDFAGITDLGLFSNPVLTDLSAMATWGFAGSATFGHSISIRDSPAITDLSDLSDLLAAAPDSLSVELSDMSGLTSLKGLGGASRGRYSLSGLPQITDLQPLANVKTLGGLSLSDIPLTTLDGLDSLQSADLGLYGLPQLASLQGLESFQTGDLTMIDLPLLTSLAPLGAFTQSEAIVLYDLPLVTSLAGLDNLQVVDSFMIGDCVNEGRSGMTGLTDLQGLGALTSVREFMVTNGKNLKSLAGVDKLTSVDWRLAIINNPQLPQAAFDAFVAQVAEPEMTCFGDWDVCECIYYNPG